MALQTQLPTTDWTSIVWCKHSLPRYAIVLWLACWKKKNTLDKLLSWRIIQVNSCVPCDGQPEDHDHLFFQCSFSSMVWAKVLRHIKCKFRSTGWEDNIGWLNDNNGWSTKLQKDIAYFAFSSIVYHLWRERNCRLFQKIAKSQELVIKDILQSITYNVRNWRNYKYNKFNWELAMFPPKFSKGHFQHRYETLASTNTQAYYLVLATGLAVEFCLHPCFSIVYFWTLVMFCIWLWCFVVVLAGYFHGEWGFVDSCLLLSASKSGSQLLD